MAEQEKKNEQAAERYSPADNGHVQTRKRKEQRDQQRLDDARLFVMSDPRGRLFVMNLLESCGVFRSSFMGNSTTDFREGERNVGLRMIDELEKKTPKEFLAMWQEHLTEKTKPEVLPPAERENDNGR